MGETSARPIDENEAARLFADLLGYRSLVLAVSGGPDSMALMRLMAQWARRCGKEAPELSVVTVDHGLRPESRSEADFVGEAARALGLPHTVLTWRGGPPTSGLQAVAREARYALLGAHAAALLKPPAAVVVAHTEDDQAETLLMRLARGSGLDGLAGMARTRPRAGDPAVMLERPLLGVAKSRLRATLDALGQPHVDDPSNESLYFERVRLRQALPVLRDLGLHPHAVARAARRLRRAQRALDQAARQAFCETVDVHAGVFATIRRTVFCELAEEVQLRVLVRTLAAFGGASRAPRLSQVEELLDALTRHPRHAQTLGGAMVSAGTRLIRVYREPRRSDLCEIRLKPGETAQWDDRFHILLRPGGLGRDLDRQAPVLVKPLGEMRPFAGLPRGGPDGPLPARALETLPAFWLGDRLLAVPSLATWLPELAGPREDGHEVCVARFSPDFGPIEAALP